MELTNSLRKTIASLNQTKTRCETGWFVAEGTKCVLETVNAFHSECILAPRSWIDLHPEMAHRVTCVSQSDINRMSQLKTPQQVLAVYHIPPQPAIDPDIIRNELVLALDHVQDPGNMGTIIRIADWFGIHTILADDCVDIFNPKVVQATMGSIARVKVANVNLPQTLKELAQLMPVYGTFLNGRNIYEADLTPNGIIVMGNEGKGITAEVAETVTSPLFIPPYPGDSPTAESLNVGVATAVTVAEFRRRIIE